MCYFSILLLCFTLWAHPPDLAAWPEIPPPLSSLERFPSAATCDDMLSFFAARRAWLDGQRDLFRQPCYAPYFDAAGADLEWRRAPWQELHEAQQHGGDGLPDYCRTRAREHLAVLRRLLGDWAFDACALPGPCSWEFTRPIP